MSRDCKIKFNRWESLHL